MSMDCVLFDFATKFTFSDYFLPLSRQMRLKDFVNFEPWLGSSILFHFFHSFSVLGVNYLIHGGDTIKSE